MNRIFVSTALAALLAFGGSANAQSMVKLGTVDMKKIFESYYKTKDAEQRINEVRNAAKKELEERVEAYKKGLAEAKKLTDEIENPALSNDAKGKKKKDRDDKVADIQSMEREINEFRQTREKQIQEQSARMRAGIVDEINKVVMDKVKADSYDVVLDKSGMSLNSVNVVMFAKESFDFTDEVVTTLNKNRGNEPGPVAAVADKPTPAALKAKKP